MAYTGKAHPEVRINNSSSFFVLRIIVNKSQKKSIGIPHYNKTCAHDVQLAGPDEIVFTYVANTPGVVYPLFEDGADVMYVPRFVRLKLKGGDDKRRGLKKRRWRVRQKLLEQEREQEPEPGKHRALRTRRRRRKRGGH